MDEHVQWGGRDKRHSHSVETRQLNEPVDSSSERKKKKTAARWPSAKAEGVRERQRETQPYPLAKRNR